MMKRNLGQTWWTVMILGGLLLLASSVTAQSAGQTRVYEAPDASFAFTFPGEWQLTTVRGLVYVSGDGMTISVVGPSMLEAAGLDNSAPLRQMAEALQMRLGLESDETPFSLSLNNRPAARLDAPNHEGYPGFLLVVFLSDGHPAAVDVRFTEAQSGAESEAIALALIESLEIPTGVPPAQLLSYLETPVDIRSELEAAGVIPSGTQPIFIETDTFRQGRQDALFISLASSKPAQDVLLGGTLEFSGGTKGPEEACTLGLRITADAQNVITSYLEIGVTGDGDFFYLDYTGSAATSQTRTSLRPVTSDDPQIVALAQGDTLSVYVDGVLFFDRVPVTAREGSYGIGLISGRNQARCVGHDIWAYEIPPVEPDSCMIRTRDRVNRRVGPGLEFEPVALLNPGDMIQAVARSFDPEGELWWALADGTYVSAEVVDYEGYCVTLPERP